MNNVVIIGGNECMVREYKDVCSAYQCRAKVFPKTSGSLKNKIGNPNLLILFTNTMSHKMLHCAIRETKGQETVIARSHSSSISALKNILDQNICLEGSYV